MNVSPNRIIQSVIAALAGLYRPFFCSVCRVERDTKELPRLETPAILKSWGFARIQSVQA